ncbi:MAG: type II toxin-antitoxin system PemK/MazF family toxin [Lawsonibacter sp.]|jgi:mRNA interferase MazF|nr:type II toxin-antitoxin system PemK/MazF family toxin [Lawsonibacter sp.]
MSRTYLRGDLYYADLGHGIGSEQKGTRPVVIIQNNVGNKHSPTVIIAAVTSKANVKAKLPTHYYLDAGNGLAQPSLILLEQIRTVDKQRLSSYIGRLDKKHIQGINHALAVSIGLIEPVPPKLTLCLCGACADAFCGTGAFALQKVTQGQAEKEVCAYCKQGAGERYAVRPRAGKGSI